MTLQIVEQVGRTDVGRQRSVNEDALVVAPPFFAVADGMGGDRNTVHLLTRDGADINVDDPFASSAHARIFQRGDYMYVEDMGSTNGTYLNGRQLKAAERLKVADKVRIGDTEYTYQE